MSNPAVVALDLALDGPTGLCRADGSTTSTRVDSGGTGTSRTRWKQLPIKAASLRDWAMTHGMGDASLVVIEEPIIGRRPKRKGDRADAAPQYNLNAVEPLYTLHAIFSMRLRHQRTLRVHPSTLKSYAGVVRKEDVHDAALALGWAGPQRGGIQRDEADAVVLWFIGRHVEGDPVCEVTKKREAIASRLRDEVV